MRRAAERIKLYYITTPWPTSAFATNNIAYMVSIASFTCPSPSIRFFPYNTLWFGRLSYHRRYRVVYHTPSAHQRPLYIRHAELHPYSPRQQQTTISYVHETPGTERDFRTSKLLEYNNLPVNGLRVGNGTRSARHTLRVSSSEPSFQ